MEGPFRAAFRDAADITAVWQRAQTNHLLWKQRYEAKIARWREERLERAARKMVYCCTSNSKPSMSERI